MSVLSNLLQNPDQATKVVKAAAGDKLLIPPRVQAQLADEAAEAAMKLKAPAAGLKLEPPVEEAVAGPDWGGYAKGAAYGAGGLGALTGAGYLAGMVNPLDAEDYQEDPDVSALSPAWKTALVLGLLGGGGVAGMARYSDDAIMKSGLGQAIGGALGGGVGLGAGAALGGGYGLGRRDNEARRAALEDPLNA